MSAPGDVLCHIYHGDGNTVLRDGAVADALFRAQEQGLILDVAQGQGNFSIPLAAECIRQGLLPDTISTDLNIPNWGSPTSLAYRHLFLDSMMIVCLMRKPFSQSHKRLANGVDFCLAALVLWIAVYVLYDINGYQMRVGSLTRMDVVTGTIYMGILLELARRVAGMPMVVIALFFFSQNCLAQYLPGIFRRANMKYTSMLDFVVMRTDGIFGMPVQVMSTYVVLFMIFAALLEVSGAGNFFIHFATAVTGKARGGPAKAAVVSSAAFGTISGSAIANVAGTGAITIPLMKKTGYDATFAGAVEAVASTGGQIMPPVMGAVAFILAQNINMKYIEVAGRALLPAVLYFACVFFVVDFRAKKMNLQGTPEEDIPDLGETFRSGWQWKSIRQTGL